MAPEEAGGGSRGWRSQGLPPANSTDHGGPLILCLGACGFTFTSSRTDPGGHSAHTCQAESSGPRRTVLALQIGAKA